jgi:hypothetical protein
MLLNLSNQQLHLSLVFPKEAEKDKYHKQDKNPWSNVERISENKRFKKIKALKEAVF